jgi:hypothetical protein
VDDATETRYQLASVSKQFTGSSALATRPTTEPGRPDRAEPGRPSPVTRPGCGAGRLRRRVPRGRRCGRPPAPGRPVVPSLVDLRVRAQYAVEGEDVPVSQLLDRAPRGRARPAGTHAQSAARHRCNAGNVRLVPAVVWSGFRRVSPTGLVVVRVADVRRRLPDPVAPRAGRIRASVFAHRSICAKTRVCLYYLV